MINIGRHMMTLLIFILGMVALPSIQSDPETLKLFSWVIFIALVLVMFLLNVILDKLEGKQP